MSFQNRLVRRRSILPSSGTRLLSVLWLLMFHTKWPVCHCNTELGFMICGVRMIDCWGLSLDSLMHRSVATLRLSFVHNTGCLSAAYCVSTATMTWLVFCFVSTPECWISEYILTIWFPMIGAKWNIPALSCSNSVAIFHTLFVKKKKYPFQGI